MEFYDKVKEWWDKSPDKRDYSEGAKLMLQITMNRIQYNNVMRCLDRHHEDVDWVISRYIKEHLSEETRSEVRLMRQQADIINAKRNLDGSTPHSNYKGRRPDHEDLPEEIQALYSENLTLLQQMRDLQTQLRIIARDPQTTCLDSEQYPFLKELIAKDKRMRENWRKYDEYTAQGYAQAKQEEEAKEASNKATRLLNLYKGKYKKNPSAELKAKILEQLNLIMEPSQKMMKELKELGIYEKDG